VPNDQGKVFAGAADDGHPTDLPGTKCLGKSLAGLKPAAFEIVECQPAAHLDLVDLFEPAITEHRLGQPFVGKILQQVRKECHRR
jgi:hypothetical protein